LLRECKVRREVGFGSVSPFWQVGFTGINRHDPQIRANRAQRTEKDFRSSLARGRRNPNEKRRKLSVPAALLK
jgi:hypothetical protein